MKNKLTYFGKETLFDLVHTVTKNTLHAIQGDTEVFKTSYDSIKKALIASLESVEEALPVAQQSYSDGDVEKFSNDSLALGLAGGECEGNLIRFMSYATIISMHPDYEQDECSEAGELIQRGSKLLEDVESFVESD